MKSKIYYNQVSVGGDGPITVQSMTTTETANINATVKQILDLQEVGCDIIRCAVPDLESAKALQAIKNQIQIPLIADIHFDYRLAIASVHSGADGIRINPGNIGSKDKVKEVVKACKEKNIPIRVGVNSGSVKQSFLDQYHGLNAISLVESALEQVRMIESFDYNQIVVSIKASDVRLTYDAYRLINEKIPYPLHVGITEAGTMLNGTIKSAMGIGALLLQGIGDTIRISLTDDPIKEVVIGRKMLQFLGLRAYGPNFISCPTCGRTKINLTQIAQEVETRLSQCKKDVTIAIMGCVVNGPGEAKEADIGIAGGNGQAVLFKKGVVIRKLRESEIIDVLIEEVDKL